MAKSNIHRKLYNPDYFGWHYYCFGARRRRRKYDKQRAKEAARHERKTTVVQTNIFDEVEEHENCTVQILKNSITGETSVGWWENES